MTLRTTSARLRVGIQINGSTRRYSRFEETAHEFTHVAGNVRKKRRVWELGVAAGVSEAIGDRTGGKGCGAGQGGCG